MIDVVEIDAASYTSVDDIREIIEHAKFTPTQGTYKIYIIDEVHMLSKNAFNALLKTIEEPPLHAIFLLATTEIQKVPDTILSRVIRFDLTKIGEKDMYNLLVKICGQEGVSYEDNALKMIVHRARWSIRDSLTMLEKCIIDTSVTEKNVVGALHLVNSSFLRSTFDACINGNAWEIGHVLSTINNEGIDVRQFSAQMTEWIVDTIEEAFDRKMFPTYKEIFDLFTRVFVQSKQVSVPMDILRMALYERITSGQLSTHQAEPVLNQKNITEEPHIPIPAIEENANPKKELEPWVFSSESYIQKIQEMWIKSTLIPLLKTAKIELRGDTLVIQTTAFCQSRCVETSIRQVLENAAKSFHAEKISIIVSSSPENSAPEESSEDVARAIFSE